MTSSKEGLTIFATLYKKRLTFIFQSDDDGDARQLELEQRLIESRLRQQQLQSEEDSKWLLQEENNLKKRLSITGSLGSDDLTGSNDNVASGCSSVDATKERPILFKVSSRFFPSQNTPIFHFHMKGTVLLD